MVRQNRRIQAVLFDLDDTLFDWSGQNLSYDDLFRPHVDNIYDHLLANSHGLPEREAFFQCYRATIVAHWDRAKETLESVNFGNVLVDCFEELNLEVEGLSSGNEAP